MGVGNILREWESFWVETHVKPISVKSGRAGRGGGISTLYLGHLTVHFEREISHRLKRFDQYVWC